MVFSIDKAVTVCDVFTLVAAAGGGDGFGGSIVVEETLGGPVTALVWGSTEVVATTMLQLMLPADVVDVFMASERVCPSTDDSGTEFTMFLMPPTRRVLGKTFGSVEVPFAW